MKLKVSTSKNRQVRVGVYQPSIGDRLANYFGKSDLLFIAKEIIFGVAELIWIVLWDGLIMCTAYVLFFFVLVPILKVTGLERPFKRAVRKVFKIKSYFDV